MGKLSLDEARKAIELISQIDSYIVKNIVFLGEYERFHKDRILQDSMLTLADELENMRLSIEQTGRDLAKPVLEAGGWVEGLFRTLDDINRPPRMRHPDEFRDRLVKVCANWLRVKSDLIWLSTKDVDDQ